MGRSVPADRLKIPLLEFDTVNGNVAARDGLANEPIRTGLWSLLEHASVSRIAGPFHPDWGVYADIDHRTG